MQIRLHGEAVGTADETSPSAATNVEVASDSAPSDGVVATPAIADRKLQELLHEQQLTIANLQEQIAAQEATLAVAAAKGSARADMEQSTSAPLPAEDQASTPQGEPPETAAVEHHPAAAPTPALTPTPAPESIETATSTSAAPWKIAAVGDMRKEIGRLSAQLADAAHTEQNLRSQIDAAETAKQLLQHDIQLKERSLLTSKAAPTLQEAKYGGAVESRDTLRQQMLQVVDHTLGDVSVATTAVTSVSRVERAQLHEAGVHDTCASVLVPNEVIGVPVDLTLEANDGLQVSEIIVRAVGITPRSEWTARRVYFVVQFYHFAPAVSEAVTVEPDDAQDGKQASYHFVRESQTSLEDTDSDEEHVSMKFVVDGSSGSGCDSSSPQVSESRRLAAYLCSGAMHLEVWDADTLLPLGSIKTSLSGLLRQGQPSVNSTLQLDLRTDRLPGGGGGKICGTMQLSVANIGRMSSNAGASLAKAVRRDDTVTVGPIVSAVVPTSRKGRVRHRQRAAQIAVSVAEASQAPTVSEEERKLTRLRRVVATRLPDEQDQGGADANIERLEQLQRMEIHRGQDRDMHIADALHTSITRRLRLNTRFGETSFFEFIFQNPFATNR